MTTPDALFSLPDDLWDQAITRFDDLKANSKLFYGPYETTLYQKNDLKVAFQIAPQLDKKPILPADAPERKSNHVKRNPFANPDPEFTLCHVGPSHTLMLNMYCVYRPSLILVTRQYAPQSDVLDTSDLGASWTVLQHLSRAQTESRLMIFYNCGAESGSSQGHKHMQIMPYPQPEEIGLQVFPARAESTDQATSGLSGVPYAHFVLKLPDNSTIDDVVKAHGILQSVYREFLKTRGHEVSSSPPHNLLLTSSWICLVPRRHSGAERDALTNAMGMVGIIWVANEGEIAEWSNASGSVEGHFEYLGYPIQG
ncbi:hypothetical protein CDV31_010505 [Fusarium ambrosium]|uniref:Uncharacterized protein n=1 Tax=Fusarium ambrosium TaxID=131363 RepID=A0A428TN03_9HYPO|nr:hypothetical protein CDV31_010505 [Fusarium ambrosium]